MKKTSPLIWVILLIMPFVSSVSINEFMYNPLGDDNNKEFVEIIGTANLSGYTIGDSASNDSLTLLKFIPGDFSLIVEEGFNHTSINCSVYSAGATIGNNLNNDADTVFLYYSGEVIDSVHYDGILANNNGYSLELVNDSWLESCAIGGSPGRENCQISIDNETTNETGNATINDTMNQTTNITINETINQTINETDENVNITVNESEEDNSTSSLRLEIILSERVFVGVTYDSLFKITNLDHSSGDESFVLVIVNYNVTQDGALIFEDSFNKTINYYSSSNTGKLFFEQAGIYLLCASIMNTMLSACKEFEVVNPLDIPCFIEINVSTDKLVYEEGEKIKIRHELSNESFPFIIEYWIEDLFSRIVKDKVNTSNTNVKSYTPKIDEDDQVLLAKARLAFIGCDNSNSEIEKEAMIIIKKPMASIESNEEAESRIKIEQVYDSKIGGLNFGDEFKVRLSIHRGTTDKSTINVFVRGKDEKKVSDDTTFYLNKKNSDYNLTVKVLLKPNCEEKFSDGEHTLVAEGLDDKAEKKILIAGNAKNSCKKTEQKEQEQAAKIISFYTKNKKFSKNISLYANINASSNCELVLLSKDGEYKAQPNSSGNVKFSVEPEPGINLFVLQIRNKTKVLDTKTLLVNLETSQNSTAVKKELLLEENKTSEENNASSTIPITGSVVYESANTKALKFAPYFLVLVVALVILGLFLWKKRVR